MGYASAEIHKYDANGKFLRTLGRAGEGPGEFMRIRGFHVNADDELVVQDERWKYVFLDGDGGFLREIKFPFERGRYRAAFWPFDGGYLVNQYISDSLRTPIFYIFDDSFKAVADSFGTVYDLYNFDKDPVFNARRSQGGRLKLAWNRQQIFACVTEFYDGSVVIFSKGDQGWVFRRVRGKYPDLEPFKMHKITDRSKGKSWMKNL